MATFTTANESTRQQLPSTFFDYQKTRQAGMKQTNPTGGTTTTKPATQWQTYKPQNTQPIQPGGVSRPDGRPTPGEQPARSQSVNTATPQAQPTPPPAPTRTPVNVKDYPTVDFNKLNVGDPVQGKPGATWNHNGQGWEIVSGGTPSGGGTQGSAPPTPTGGYWTQQLGNYKQVDFSGINSPIYNPNKFEINGPDMYGQYQAGNFNISTPEMFGGYQKTDFSGIKGPNDYAGYKQFDYNTQLPTSGYKPGSLGTDPFSSYNFNRGDISQFGGVNQGNMQGGINSLMDSLLANPTSMTAQGVAQMKERQKEQILQSQKAMGQQNAELMAQRGMVGGGQDMAQQMALQNQAQKDLLSSYRDVDLQKMQQDFADKQAVGTLANSIMSGNTERAAAEYNALLSGQKAREDYTAESAASKQAADIAAFNRAKGQEDLNIAADTSAQNLAKLGLSKEELMARENKNLFDANSQQFQDYLRRTQLQKDVLDSSALENQRQYQSGQDIFNAGMQKSQFGLDQAKLNQDEQFKAWQSKQAQYQDQLKKLGLDVQTAGLNQAEAFKGYDSQAQAIQDRIKALAAQAGENQFGASYGQGNASTLGKFAESDATRELQKYLAEKGFGVDYAKIAQNSDLAKMDDRTKRYGINMDFVNSMLNRDQSGSQFNKTMAFNQKGQDNSFFQWLMGQGLV